MKFKNIDIEKDRDVIISFRKDSFMVSFGADSGFDEEEYLSWIKDNSESFPEGFVLVEEDGQYIGQLE